jgi:hypothetical protein
MDKKTIAFFGDSFLGNLGGWVAVLCKKHDYQCVHIGKSGADPIYVFEQWDKFNRSGQKADICIYAHTGVERLYHPDKAAGLTNGVVEAMVKNEIPLFPIENSRKTIKAAHDYYTYLNFEAADGMRTKIIPLGIDKLMKDTNVAFGKIIHIWSFAQHRYNFSNNNWTADSSWSLSNTVSGSNILLDLSTLSSVEPGFKHERFDSRVNHFSNRVNPFMCGLMEFAIEQTDFASDKKVVVDFRPYVDRNSQWKDYLDAFEKIKIGLP